MKNAILDRIATLRAEHAPSGERCDVLTPCNICDLFTALDGALASHARSEWGRVEALSALSQRETMLQKAVSGRTTLAKVDAALRDYPDADVSALYVPASEALEYRQAWRRDLAKGREIEGRLTQERDEALRLRDEQAGRAIRAEKEAARLESQLAAARRQIGTGGK